MIKLIASDVDGTLLLDRAQHIDPLIFSQIRQLQTKGIRFCVASGRQYSSLKRLFAPVADRVLFICENGSIVFEQDKILSKTPLPLEHARQLIGQIVAQPDCEVLISGANTSYLLPKSPAVLEHMENVVQNNVVVVDHISEIPEEIIKISACTHGNAANYKPVFAPVWERYLHVAVAGEHWLDFTLAHKGSALEQISAHLGISPRDILVFGDNDNDVSMFRCAGDSYAMADAAPEVQAAAKHICANVSAVLQDILDGRDA